MPDAEVEKSIILHTLHPFLFRDYVAFDTRYYENEIELYNFKIDNTWGIKTLFFLQ